MARGRCGRGGPGRLRHERTFYLGAVGGLVTMAPLIALFLILLRYWRSGILLGSLAN